MQRIDSPTAPRTLEVDALIIGGGIQGVTLLHELVAAGARRVLLASRGALGSGETLQSHGYLHHGYLLPTTDGDTIRDAAACAPWWWRRVEGVDTPYRSQPSTAFAVPTSEAGAQLRAWRELGLDATEIVETPPALRRGRADDQGTRLLGIHDRTVPLRALLAGLAAPLQEHIVDAELQAIELTDDARHVRRCRLSAGGETLIVHPGRLLLAASRHAQPLLRAAATRDGRRPLMAQWHDRHRVRFVPMLLVRGRDLPALSGHFGDPGLLVCSHPLDDGETLWIVTATGAHPVERGDFERDRELRPHPLLRTSLERLEQLAPAALRAATDLRLSAYMGGKVDHPDGRNARFVDDCGVANLRVVWPGLWSLALANARDLTAELRAAQPTAFAARQPLDLRALGLRPGADLGEVHWESANRTWRSREQWLLDLEHTDVASTAGRGTQSH